MVICCNCLIDEHPHKVTGFFKYAEKLREDMKIKIGYCNSKIKDLYDKVEKISQEITQKEMRRNIIMEELNQIDNALQIQLKEKERFIVQKEETESNYQILTSYMEKVSDLEIVNEGSIITQILGDVLPTKVENEIQEPERKNTEGIQIQPVVLPSSAERKNTESIQIQPVVLPSSSSRRNQKKMKCNVCNRKIPLSDYNDHLQSKGHKIFEIERIYCESCNKFFNQEGYVTHLNGKKHLKLLGN